MKRTATAACALALALGSAAAAQSPARTSVVRGVVTLSQGTPLPDVNVFLLETLEGAVTDAAGRFAIVTAFTGAATLVARRVGFTPQRLALLLPHDSALAIAMGAEAVSLPPITVEAGTYRAANEANVALTSLQVVTTPGSAADVYRAIQTFPGLQTVDEGAGLFVRGGDVSETRILVNDAVVLSPYRYESPTGGFFGSFDPFLLDGIYFSSGGFGARYGDALSGVVALNTLGRPAQHGIGATASLAALSTSGALALPHGLGIRGTATRSNTDLMFRLNGSVRDYTQAPEGRDLSGTAIWEYRPGGEVKLFAHDQWNQLGVVVDQTSFTGSFAAHEGHNFVVASWRDHFGRVAPLVSLSRAGSNRQQSYGAFQLDNGERLLQAHARAAIAVNGWWTVTAGGEIVERRDDVSGSLPSSHDNRPGARVTLYRSILDGVRRAAFAESDMQLSGRFRATLGLRTDDATLSQRRTVDPRVAAAVRLSPGLSLTGAWGIYHQVAAPSFYEPTIGDPSLAPARASQQVIGGELHRGAVMLRVEAYRKNYRNLAQWTRDGAGVGGGRGRTTGGDLFFRWNRGFVTGRVAYSYAHATRTDPDAGTVGRSPFDITNTLSIVAERGFGRFRTGLAWRYATGRPFTPVVSASPDTVPGVWVPAYGTPNGERLPAFSRLDLSASWLHSFWRGNLTVVFVGISNALDRENLYGYRYTPDYTQRIPIRSQFKRAIYFGATLQFGAQQ